MQRCKLCHKQRERFSSWLYKGKFYKGCEYCRLNMIKKIKKEEIIDENSDDLL
jgi:hypothetical protein